MATSIQSPSNTNIIVNEWTYVYSSAPVAGFTGTVRIVVEVGNGTTIKLTNNATGVTAITQGYGNLYDGNATSIAFEGSQEQVNAALQSLQAFNSNAAGSGTLQISAVKAGSAYNPANGHYYQAIDSVGGMGWLAAKTAAASDSLKFNGLTGYLATITSAQENEFILNKLPADAWIGATDKDTEGHWKWDTGPEAGQEFWYWNGSTGVTVDGRYHNWNSNEPNDSTSHTGSPEGEDYGQFYVSGGTPGKWNDLPGAGATAGILRYYVVEYGGMAGDTPTEAAASSSSTLTVQDRPVISSNGGDTPSPINYAENGTAAVTTVTASDADSGDSKAYSITGGADAALFDIDSSTGALTFKSSPDYEGTGDNSYAVTVRVTDSAGLYDEQTLTVNVTDVNDLPIASGSLPASIATTEDATVVVDLSALGFSDQDTGDTFTLKLTATNGTLAATGTAQVTVVGSGSDTLTLTGKPADITAFLDTVSNIQYTGAINNNGSPAATIAVSYKDSAMDSFQALGSAIAVNIDAVNDAPALTVSGTPYSYAENGTAAVTTFAVTDVDTGDGKTFAISGGIDADLFNIDASTGALTFRNAPNFEIPADSDNNNSYAVTVKVTDSGGLSDEKSITVNVIDDTSAADPIETGGTEPATITAPVGNAKINVIGSSTTTVTNPAGNLNIANSGSGTVTVQSPIDNATLTTTGTGPTTVTKPAGDLALVNNGTATVAVDGLNTDSVLSTTGSGPTAVTNPDGNLSVANNGTGTVTVGGLNSGASLTANGTGPTQISDPEGSLTVVNGGTGTVTVDGLNTDSVLSTTGSGPTAVTNLDGNLSVSNTGTGTVTVNGLNSDASLSASGTGPTLVNNPEGSLNVANSGGGTVTVDGLNTGAVLTATGSGPTAVTNPDGNLSVSNTGTGTVTVNGLKPNASLSASGSGPTLVENPDASLIVANSGTGTVTVNGLNTGGVLTTTGSGPTAVTNPDGSLAVANNGTGTLTVNGLNPNASLTANGTGPTLVNDPEGNLTVSNSGSGTVTVAGLSDDAVLSTMGSGPTVVSNPDADVSLVNNGTGEVTVDGMNSGAVFNSSGSGPVTISNPDGNLRVANNGTGAVTVEDLKAGSTLTTTGSQPVIMDLSHLTSGQSITIDNDGSGVVNLVNVPEGVTVNTTGSGTGGINYAPTFIGVPSTAQGVNVGSTAALVDFTVADRDSNQTLTVTLTTTNGTIGGLTDADSNTAGIQLTGTAADINTALASATFTAASTGAASMVISLTDNKVSNPVTSTYNLSATAAPTGGGGTTTPTEAPTEAPGTPVTETIDGIQVESVTVVAEDGTRSERVTVSPVTEGREDEPTSENDELADIPLFWGESTRTQQATTVSLPTGIGVVTEGNRAPVAGQTIDQAVNDLVGLINQNTTDSETTRSKMLAGGESFVQSLQQQNTETLIVNQVTLTTADTLASASSQPIIVSGTNSQITTSSGVVSVPMEALIINAKSLPAGSKINLENIEFAVILGDDVEVIGGEGNNIVFAGAGTQTLILGEGNDELHGGGDSDTVGSKGGDDRLYGDAGNDVLFGGTGNDQLDGGDDTDIALFQYALNQYQINQNSDGSWTISHAIEGTDTLNHIEFAEFADQTLTLSGSNQWLNVLFQQNISLF